MNRQSLLLIVLSVLCYRTTPALEVNLLSAITDSPRDFNVRKVFEIGRNGGYLFDWDVKSIKAEEKLLQEVIVNIESNKEFVIYASIKILSSRTGALFSISHSQRKLLLLDLFTKGIGNKTKLILRYRSTDDKVEDVVFKGLGALGDRRYHTIVLRISDVMTENGKKISSVTLYLDCKQFGKVETVSPISSIFSYRGTLLSRLEFRLGQRGFGSKIHTQWRGVMESILLIFKRPIREILDELDCALKSGGQSGVPEWRFEKAFCHVCHFTVKAPQEPLIAGQPSAITHEVILDLIGVIKDLRYDLSMQVAEIKYLRGLVENCQMCRVQDFCRFKPCFPGVPCFNEPASEHGFECGECPLGMLGDGINCTDVDECKLADPCAKNTPCHNRSPGYWCPPCPPGYSGKEIHGIGLYYARNNKQECTDIDECAEDPAKCAKESKCINTLGGYTCGDCAPGYTGDPYRSCYYLSYCDPSDPRSNPCHQFAKCIRLDSGRSFKCECHSDYAGNGLLCAEDFDIDGFPDVELNCSEKECRKDNCPQIKNTDQADLDEDGIGDVCDEDWDGDGIKNDLDNCPRHSNSNQRNSDGDLLGNECDNCPFVSNSYQADIDKDGQGDACDRDVDNDGQLNSIDNCPTIYNPGQEDQDGDTVGDVCDNCPSVRNSRQFDKDDDGFGDYCDTDRDNDNDGVDDMFDNCRGVANPDQIDNDKDEKGDACDDDDDDDGVSDSEDNCQLVPNPTQRDLNGNGVGDPCDGDFDGDKVPDAEDACPVNYHCSRTDFSRLLIVNLSPAEENGTPAVWVVDATGTKVTETENSDPGIAVGDVHFGGVDFSGTLQVATTHDDDFVGIVFSYQNNRKFYLVSWKQRDQVYWEVKPFRASAVAGIQIKLVNSKTGPGNDLRNALWHSGDAKGQTKELWRDANQRGWEDNAEYDWQLIHRPSRGLMRLKVFKAGERIVDTGYLIDKTLNGGRLGLYVFSQSNVVWKNMFYKCNEIIPTDVSAN